MSQQGISVPDIITESGRAVVASHSILVTEVCDKISKDSVEPIVSVAEENGVPILESFKLYLEDKYNASPFERYHNAIQKKEEADNLFNLGYLSLKDKGTIDAIFGKFVET